MVACNLVSAAPVFYVIDGFFANVRNGRPFQINVF